MPNKRKPAGSKGSVKVCRKGHRYVKSSDCPTCPICEAMRKPETGLLKMLSAPARRALENHAVFDVQQLAAYTQQEVLGWHGMGPSSLPKLKAALEKEGMGFRE